MKDSKLLRLYLDYVKYFPLAQYNQRIANDLKATKKLMESPGADLDLPTKYRTTMFVKRY